MLSGHPRTTPLWLNSHPSPANGAHAAVETGIPTVAERTAAIIDRVVIVGAMSRNEESVHIGRSRRYTTSRA